MGQVYTCLFFYFRLNGRSGVRVLRDMVRGLGPAIARLRAISDESKHVVVDMPTQEEIDASLNQTLDEFFKSS